MKGGVGKSTLAANIADVLARRHGKRVLLIDTDPQFNATQMLVSGDDYFQKIQAGQNTILDVFDDQPKVRMSAVAGPLIVPAVALDQIAPWSIPLPDSVPGGSLHLLAGDLELYRLEMNQGAGRERRLKRFIEICEARDDFDFVIIDTPPTPSTWMTAALFASDYYVIPVRPEPISRTGVDLLKGVVDRIYKAAMMNSRSGIENLFRVIAGLQHIDFRSCKSVFELIDLIKKSPLRKTSSTFETSLNVLLEKYSEYCNYVHSTGEEFLSLDRKLNDMPRWQEPAGTVCVDSLVKMIQSAISILLILSPNTLRNLHHDQRDLVLDSLPKGMKAGLAKDLPD